MPTRFFASGRPFEQRRIVGQRLGVGLGLADLVRDRVVVVGQVDPALSDGSDLDIFTDPSRRLITRAAVRRR